MPKAKHNLWSIKVTKSFDQHDHCDQQIFKGVKTSQCILTEANAMHSYCEAMWELGNILRFIVTINIFEYIETETHSLFTIMLVIELFQ